jgi:uncharacterized protein
MTTNSQHPVVHFEIGCANQPETQGFYQNVFGWQPNAGGIIHADGPGIPGHIVSLGHEPHQYVTVYIQVPDMAAALEKVMANGGQKVVGPIPLPTGQHFAWIKDNGGNLLGLVTPAGK